MKLLNKASLVLAMLAICFQARTARAEDPLDVQSELLEVEAAIADSEAAKAEVTETQRRLAREKKDSQLTKERAYTDMKKAKKEEERSRDHIAVLEKKILEAQDEQNRAKKDIEAAKDMQEKAKIDMERVASDLEKSQKERDRYADLRKNALAEKNVVVQDMNKLVAKYENMKKIEKSALKDLTRAEAELRDVRERAKKSLDNGHKDSKEYLRIVQEHRDSLKKIAKKLDEIEVEVEVDVAYEEKQERKQVAMERTRNIASVSTSKFAKVTSPACNIRNSPATNSKVMGTYKLGRKVHVKLHDKSWYTTVFNGEKVFLGAGCFE